VLKYYSGPPPSAIQPFFAVGGGWGLVIFLGGLPMGRDLGEIFGERVGVYPFWAGERKEMV
jgi:hypothetical protein